MTMPEERTKSGNIIHRGFALESDPTYSSLLKRGYHTWYEKAPYYWGMINVPMLKIITYTEGDLYEIIAEDLPHLRAEVADHLDWFKENEPSVVRDVEAELKKIDAAIQQEMIDLAKSGGRTRSSQGNPRPKTHHDITYVDRADKMHTIRNVEDRLVPEIVKVLEGAENYGIMVDGRPTMKYPPEVLRFHVGDIVETPRGRGKVVGAGLGLVTVFSPEFGEVIFDTAKVRKA